MLKNWQSNVEVLPQRLRWRQYPFWGGIFNLCEKHFTQHLLVSFITIYLVTVKITNDTLTWLLSYLQAAKKQEKKKCNRQPFFFLSKIVDVFCECHILNVVFVNVREILLSTAKANIWVNKMKHENVRGSSTNIC